MKIFRKLTAAAVILTIGIGAWLWVMMHQDEYEIHYEEIE